MKIRKEFVIGIIASFTLIAFYWGFSFLKGNDIFDKEREFVLVYDKVSGLSISNTVSINGLTVGKVSYVGFLPNDTNARILVRIKLDNDIEIPSNTLAIIRSDFLGSNHIDLKLRPSNSFAKPGDTLLTSVATTIKEEVSMQMLPIKVKAEEMMASLDSVLGAIRYVFNKKTQENLAATFVSIQNTINTLEHSSYGIDTLISSQAGPLNRIFANIESITKTIKDNNSKIDNVIANFSKLSDSLAQVDIKNTLDQMDKALSGFQEIVDKVNKGEGTMGQLVNNDTLYYELEGASRELHQLLEDIKLNPSRYVKVSVFGGKNNDEYVNPNDSLASAKKKKKRK
jgi:phospholipid/cholesterol/gamma-HCH transport system substrate-binding protein